MSAAAPLSAPPAAGPSDYLGRAADFVKPDFHQVNLDLEGYLKTERLFKLDAGECGVSDAPRLLS
jgi:cleavage and polyadenylation specificity factor subunit 4